MTNDYPEATLTVDEVNFGYQIWPTLISTIAVSSSDGLTQPTLCQAAAKAGKHYSETAIGRIRKPKWPTSTVGVTTTVLTGETIIMWYWK